MNECLPSVPMSSMNWWDFETDARLGSIEVVQISTSILPSEALGSVRIRRTHGPQEKKKRKKVIGAADTRCDWAPTF